MTEVVEIPYLYKKYSRNGRETIKLVMAPRKGTGRLKKGSVIKKIILNTRSEAQNMPALTISYRPKKIVVGGFLKQLLAPLLSGVLGSILGIGGKLEDITPDDVKKIRKIITKKSIRELFLKHKNKLDEKGIKINRALVNTSYSLIDENLKKVSKGGLFRLPYSGGLSELSLN